MSSFLEPGKDGWGDIKQRVPVTVTTIDDYCSERGISNIDILKSDTQGFDLEVLRGAQHMLEERRIQLVYLEITFSNVYQHLPGLDTIFSFLSNYGFCLVSFYRFHYQHDRAGWTDALFINPEYKPITTEKRSATPQHR